MSNKLADLCRLSATIRLQLCTYICNQILSSSHQRNRHGHKSSKKMSMHGDNKVDIPYLKNSQALSRKSSNSRLYSATGQTKLNAAVEWIRLSNPAQLPAKVPTQQFRSALFPHMHINLIPLPTMTKLATKER